MENNEPKPDSIYMNYSEQEPKKKENGFWEAAKVLIIALAIIIPIRLFVVQPFIVDGDSMQPNFHHGEYLMVDEISYHLGRLVDRGEVVIFHPPNDKENYYIKRVVGLPNETIKLIEGRIFIYNSQYPQGIKISEINYLVDSSVNEEITIALGKDDYFVMGDNRGNSLDSRRFGPIHFENIRGRAVLRLFPIQQFSLLKKPQYLFSS